MEITVGNQVIKFQPHPAFSDSVAGQVVFPNNYGISIITKVDEEHPGSFMNTAMGSWDKQTFEIAIVKAYPEEISFTTLDELEEEYPEYKMNGGVFPRVDIAFIEKIVQFVKNL